MSTRPTIEIIIEAEDMIRAQELLDEHNPGLDLETFDEGADEDGFLASIRVTHQNENVFVELAAAFRLAEISYTQFITESEDPSQMVEYRSWLPDTPAGGTIRTRTLGSDGHVVFTHHDLDTLTDSLLHSGVPAQRIGEHVEKWFADLPWSP